MKDLHIWKISMLRKISIYERFQCCEIFKYMKDFMQGKISYRKYFPTWNLLYMEIFPNIKPFIYRDISQREIFHT